MIYFKFLVILIIFNIKAFASSSSYSLSELADLASGNTKGYKMAAKGAAENGGFDAWAEGQGGNGEVFKPQLDPTAPNTQQSIINIKNTLMGIPNAPIIQDAQAINAQVVVLQDQVTQLTTQVVLLQGQVTQLTTQFNSLNTSIKNNINRIDPTEATLPDSVTRVLNTPDNCALAWGKANFKNQNFTLNAGSGDPDNASLRQQLIILFNIIIF